MIADPSVGSGDRSLRQRLGYLLALSRPRFWLYLAGPVLVGLAYAIDRPADLLALAPLALVGYFLVPANGYLYGINDVFDRRIDRENPKKAGRETRYEGQRSVPPMLAVALALFVAVLWAVPAMAWPWLLGWLLLATFYSAPPLRFKTTPLLDSLSNGLYVLPGAAAYASVAGVQPPLLAVLAGWLWSMAMHTFSAIPDVDPDRAAGIETTATWLGADRAYWYCAAVWALAALAFGVLDWRAGALLAVYPALALVVGETTLPVERAYWWFPVVNTAVGMAFTLAGLWRVVDGL